MSIFFTFIEKCPGCDFEVTKEMLDYYENLKSQMAKKLSLPKRMFEKFPLEPIQDHKDFEKMYPLLVRTFHPFDETFMEFLIEFFNLNIKKFVKSQMTESDVRKLHQNINVTKLMMKNLYENLPKYFPILGVRELTMACLCNAVDLQKETEFHLDNAVENFKISHGPKHPLITNDCFRVRNRDVFVMEKWTFALIP